MADTKLVFQNAEERELWRGVVCNFSTHDIAMAYGQSKWDCADLAVLAYRARCGEAKVEFSSDGPWAVWIPRLGEWRQYESELGEPCKCSVVAFFDKDDAYKDAAVFSDDSELGPVIALFPRTLAEVKNGPAASGGGE